MSAKPGRRGVSPAPPRATDPSEIHFGRSVADIYRPLEVDDDRTTAWVEAENARCRTLLDSLEHRAVAAARLHAMASRSSFGCPTVMRRPDGSTSYVHLSRRALAEQPAVYVRDGLDGDDRVLWDPIREEPSGGLAARAHHPSPRGRFVVIELDRDGAEAGELRLLDVRGGLMVEAPILGARNASVAWKPDESGFYYSRFGDPSTDDPRGVYGRHIRYHAIGSSPADDPVIFGRGLLPTDYPSCELSPNGRWLVVTVYRSFVHSEIHLADTRRSELAFSRLTDAEAIHVPSVGDDVLFVLTDDGAPEFRILSLSPEAPGRAQWREIDRGAPSRILERVVPLGRDLLVVSSSDGIAALEHLGRDGRRRKAIALPGDGAISDATGSIIDRAAFVAFETLGQPARVLHYDGRRLQSFSEPDVAPASESEVLHLEATGSDGVRIPYAFVRPPGTVALPTVVYGYGGFGIGLKHRYSPIARLLVEQGYGFVLAKVRGGGERGSDWHRAGAGRNKPSALYDFIAITEDTVRRGLADPRAIGAWGRSGGGMLVTAVMAQRPELFRAVVAEVPLTDMIRYPLAGMGRLWLGEYGDPELPDDFRVLIEYSPYHAVRVGVRYPAVLLTTAAADARVPPWHARKLAAALLEATASEYPILLRTETAAGHGVTNPLSKVLDEQADVAAFFLAELGSGRPTRAEGRPPLAR